MVKAHLLDQQNLTDREAEVLLLMCEGDVNKVIARQLAISLKTVNTHILHINQKLQVRQASINSRCGVIGEAISRGLVAITAPAKQRNEAE